MSVPLIRLGFAITALGTFAQWWTERQTKATPSVFGQQQIGNLGLALNSKAGKKGIETVELHTIRNLKDRVGWIRKGLLADSLLPKIRTVAATIVSRRCGVPGNMKWCTPEKDSTAEAKALFYGTKNPNSEFAIRYTGDHTAVDGFTSSEALLRVPAEDCDGASRYIGALARSIGFYVKLRVVSDIKSKQPVHIYPMLGLPRTNPTSWYALDITENYGPGGQPPGAEECAKTGKPAGVIYKVQDFPV